MNELQIITNNFTPAKVDFNYEQISNHLDILLDKYKGLVFTEETVADCKKTVAELRKGQKSLDDFRKTTKKKLTESVTEFENDCKKLYKKFDEVIDPLVEQSDFFEEQRKEEKRKEVQKIIDKLVAEHNLTEKYSSQIEIKDQYLNKSSTIKSITEDLTEVIATLKFEEDLEKSNIELISGIVESVNTKDNLQLVPEVYTRLLEYEDVNSIVSKIYADAESLSKVEPIKYPEPEEEIFQPQIIIPSETDEVFVEIYEIEGTELQLEALEEFLDRNFSTWRIIE